MFCIISIMAQWLLQDKRRKIRTESKIQYVIEYFRLPFIMNHIVVEGCTFWNVKHGKSRWELTVINQFKPK